MISNATIQKAIAERLKANILEMALPNASEEIREDNWQGTAFTYPNERIKLEDQTPINDGGCTSSAVLFSILCFSEEASSKEADEIAWKINDFLHDTRFTTDEIRFIMIKSRGLIPAERKDERTWMAEARFRALVQPI